MNDWIPTYSGGVFRPFSSECGDIKIEDIAHALALTNRWGGHTREPYCVAQHCVMAVRHAPAGAEMWALLHDAAEAYLGDVVTPVKARLHVLKLRDIRKSDFVSAVENPLLRRIGAAFGLAWPIPKVVWEVDQRLRATEARCLLTQPRTDLDFGAEPYETQIDVWPWRLAEREYLTTFHDLMAGRND